MQVTYLNDSCIVISNPQGHVMKQYHRPIALYLNAQRRWYVTDSEWIGRGAEKYLPKAATQLPQRTLEEFAKQVTG